MCVCVCVHVLLLCKKERKENKSFGEETKECQTALENVCVFVEGGG